MTNNSTKNHTRPERNREGLQHTSASHGTRPPVVVVLGHVDHGKTKLLDALRKANVAEHESGGITQHIGAYQVNVGDKLITFLDTPGHEAFTAIRSRGTKVADIAILVVAADESVKPQTKEAIRIIKKEEIPLVVAINKIDKEGANPAKVKQDLAAEDILVEEWGGKVPAIEISAKEGRNLQELLDMILLVAELEELKEDTSLPAEGIIIESNLDKRRGYVATALVQKGVLKLGDWIVVGGIMGKVKSLESFIGETVFEATPSQPVLITGWTNAPQIGSPFKTAYSKDAAHRIQESNVDLTPLFSFFKASPDTTEGTNRRILNLVFKTDVSSSLEAIDMALSTIKSEEVGFKVLHYDIGNIGEGDIKTAINSNAIVVGFRVGVENSAIKLAEQQKVKIASFDIIYELIEFIRKEMALMLDPEIKKISSGKLRVLAIFKKEGKSQILGGKVVSGKIIRGSMVDISKGDSSLKIGKLTQLQHNKEDVTEVREGLEAGMKIELVDPKEEIKTGETLEMYTEEKVGRSL